MFKNRIGAGKELALKLEKYKKARPLVLGLPRGGVEVAFEIAKHLEAPLDTVVARKIGAPDNPEFGLGAIAPGDVLILDNAAITVGGVSKKDLDVIIAEEMTEMERRMVHYHSGEYGGENVADTVILADDGLATGVTATAAVESVKIRYKPKILIFAAPICANDSAQRITALVSDLVCLRTEADLIAIGFWYEEFPQLTDKDVCRYLTEANSTKVGLK